MIAGNLFDRGNYPDQIKQLSGSGRAHWDVVAEPVPTVLLGRSGIEVWQLTDLRAETYQALRWTEVAHGVAFSVF